MGYLFVPSAAIPTNNTAGLAQYIRHFPAVCFQCIERAAAALFHLYVVLVRQATATPAGIMCSACMHSNGPFIKTPLDSILLVLAFIRVEEIQQ